MQDLCKQQLEENLAREQQQQQHRQSNHTSAQSFNLRNQGGRDSATADNLSPVDYRARNGSPLRKA